FYASEAVGKEIMYWNSSQNDSSPTVEDIIENFCAGELLEGILKTNLYSSSNTLEREVENQLIFDLSSLVQVHRNFYIGLLPVEGIIKQLYNLLKTLKSLQPSNIVSSPSESPIEAFELQHLDKKRLFGLLKPLVSNLQADLEYTYLKALDQSITAFFPKAEAERKLWDNRIRHALIALGKVLRSNSPTETDGAGSDLVMEEFMLEIKEVLSKADFSLAIERIRMVVDRVPIFNQFSKELLLLEGRYQALSQNERLLFTLVHDQQGEQRSRLLYQLLEFVQKLADHYQKEMT
ncbi:MAG: hypothetical protein KDC44_23040, partial [Phaeodactylibacter sp.]|nr:hypothetical protein [Phaeodactylibacter sp.]